MRGANPVTPRVLIVSRRTVRKGKYVDFVGEFHLNLVLEYGAVPVIVPRVEGIEKHLEAFEPFHGLLLVEGEDVQPESYNSDYSTLTPHERAKVQAKFSGDTLVDPVKDKLEMELVRISVERGLPVLAICRGSQILNVVYGGDLYLDLETELGDKVVHYNTDNYDGHRHPIHIQRETPLEDWFGTSEALVNSYHHCGIKNLAPRFRPLALAPDGLVEGYYDPKCYDISAGQFIVGLQFHPERMQDIEAHLADEPAVFDHPACKAPYREFVTAVKVCANVAMEHELETLVDSIGFNRPPLQRVKALNGRGYASHHGATSAISLLEPGALVRVRDLKEKLDYERGMDLRTGRKRQLLSTPAIA
mmetsp:Transcript_5290/g.22477  ORF Transcript_5290/g.22477 Transcript_5290/m.22477 type:complete len:361 (-) Transcript_5290:459-1541(-)